MTDSEQKPAGDGETKTTQKDDLKAGQSRSKVPGEPKAPASPAKRLDEMTILDLQKMSIANLRSRCAAAKMSVAGDKEELIERLRPKVGRITRQYIEGVTTCAYCPADIVVVGTDKQPMPDGRVLVVRQIKCKGRHNHKYPLKELVKADK